MTKKQTALYGLIFETKDQAPLLDECTDMTYRAVLDRMNQMRHMPNVIRVCMVSLHYQDGNESLMKYDEDEQIPF